jgi:hypothetical protein
MSAVPLLSEFFNWTRTTHPSDLTTKTQPHDTYEIPSEKIRSAEFAGPVDSTIPVRVAGREPFSPGRERDLAGLAI